MAKFTKDGEIVLSENEQRLDKYFHDLVPQSGACKNTAGELVRAAMRIHYRNFNDGDCIGVGYGNETCNAAARYLKANGNEKIKNLIDDIWGYSVEERYNVFLEDLAQEVCDYIESEPSLFTKPTKDMFDYEKRSDYDYSRYEEEEDEDDEDEEDDGSYYSETRSARSDKPVLIANRVDGNIFNVIGAASNAMKQFGIDRDKIKEMQDRTTSSNSYEEALAVIMEYVDFA